MENMMLKNNISISILNVDKQNEFLKKVKKICDENNLNNVIIHYDIMDEKFVDGRGVDFESIVNAKNNGFFCDVHLMVEEPMLYISKAVRQGAQSITVHYETENLCQILMHLNRLKMQKKIHNVGLAIKPGTSIENIHEYLYLVDMILIMSVEPGKGGQKYIKSVNDKIVSVKGMKKIVQVDGGVNIDNISDAKKCGATSFVVGSYITSDLENAEEKLINIYNKI